MVIRAVEAHAQHVMSTDRCLVNPALHHCVTLVITRVEHVLLCDMIMNFVPC